MGPVGNSPALTEEEFTMLVDPKTGRRRRNKVDPEESYEERTLLYGECDLDLAPGNLDFQRWVQTWEIGGVDDTYEKESVHRVHEVLPEVKEKCNMDIQRLDDSKVFVAGITTSLITDLNFRVGNPKSAEEDDHIGATTLRLKNVGIRNGKVTFKYIGKSGVEHKRITDDPRTVMAVQHLRKGKKKEDYLLKYAGKGDQYYRISDEDIRDYLLEFDITPKDIRTHNANQRFIEKWNESGSTSDSTKAAAAELQHTPSVCRRNYIDDLLLSDLRKVEKGGG